MAQNQDFYGFINELKSRTNIVSVISGYLPLTRKGGTYWACCPFHGEKTPSFAVNEADGYYHCFGCKAGGDAIKFVMERESVAYMDAVAMLAEKAGMQVPNFSGQSSENTDIAERKKHKDRLLACAKSAAKFYNQNLFEGRAPEAKAYLEKRQVPDNIAIRFGLGASLNFNGVVNHLKDLGFTEKEMLDAGVVKSKEGRLYDAEAERLVFPLIDVMGNVIGFCGRILGDAKFAKYLNTAETPLFSKGKTLYGINLVKKKKQEEPNSIKYIIIVEGQMDVVSLHKAGFDTAVASMGTALTVDQARLIKRFSDNVIICYDGDFAGKKATLRGLEILKENDLNVKVMSLPEGLDPDDVIKTMGREGFIKLMKEALPLLDFKLDMVKRQFDVSTREGRTKYLDAAIEVLKEVPSDVEREVYVGLVSEVSNMNADFIKRQLKSSVAIKEMPVDVEKKTAVTVREKEVDSAVAKAQKFVLSCMMHLKPFAYFSEDINYIFGGEADIEISKAIESARGAVSTPQMIDRCCEYLAGKFEAEFSEIINYLAVFGDEASDQKYFKDCLWIVYKAYLDSKLEQLNLALSKEADNTKRKELLIEITQIINTIKNKKVEL